MAASGWGFADMLLAQSFQNAIDKINLSKHFSQFFKVVKIMNTMVFGSPFQLNNNTALGRGGGGRGVNYNGKIS